MFCVHKVDFAKFCCPLDFPGQLRFRLSELVFGFRKNIWSKGY